MRGDLFQLLLMGRSVRFRLALTCAVVGDRALRLEFPNIGARTSDRSTLLPFLRFLLLRLWLVEGGFHAHFNILPRVILTL